MINSIPTFSKSLYYQKLFKALFVLSYYACLRAGEAVNSQNKNNILLFENIQIASSVVPAFNITFNKFKCSNSSVTFLLEPSNDSRYCPVSALADYLELRGASPGPLFLNHCMTPLSRNTFANSMKGCLKLAGFDPNSYNTHSFRIGRATDLALANVLLG